MNSWSTATFISKEIKPCLIAYELGPEKVKLKLLY